ncbi:hypothetical protein CUMW_100780 [Citrus unshiu]|nr:hypothetical protein CUMW_100780 [Citrus unshiu]
MRMFRKKELKFWDQKMMGELQLEIEVAKKKLMQMEMAWRKLKGLSTGGVNVVKSKMKLS